MIVVGLTVPFLILDTPATAEGAVPQIVETEDGLGQANLVVVVERTVVADVAQLAAAASNWADARVEVEQATAAAEQQVVNAQVASAIESDFQALAERQAVEAAAERVEAEVAAVEAEQAAAEEEAREVAAQEAAVGEQAAAEAAPAEPAPEPETPTNTDGITAPAQVDGRVPPPAGGPTAAQWDQVRNCESTHNYQAVNPSGKFRGAYQFSVQTWDWIAGTYYPHLVGVDPAAAEPAWQDVMAYALYDLSGWGQWPECGRFLR